MHVLLFDIDGTLINTRGSGLNALKLAFSEVFDFASPDEIPTSGRTDRGIARRLFQDRGIEDSLVHWQRFSEAYHRHLTDQLPLRDGHLLPGVVALLEDLALRRNVSVGLLTGNTPVGARIKLQHYGIYEHFAFGGFGAEHAERDGVARDALDAAVDRLEGEVVPARVWVIGDTPLDVACARTIEAKAIAVATGIHDKQELAESSPDLLLDDLSDCDALLRLLV